MSALKLFSTVYEEGSLYGDDCDVFGAEIAASDLNEANALAARRGVGELVMRETTDATAFGIEHFIENEDWPEAIHEACFLCFFGLMSGVLSPSETLGDHGLVHSLAHIATGDPYDLALAKERCVEMASDFEARVPGWVTARQVAGLT